ncbi:MAG TPA: 23S rRNA (uracil(1939)-C(5))-methyltransferase RlmD [Desulfuromonadales bacterium]|nr:23S rRNA (uracil(1939)-C(5))-methyltransferase RlmD [Desulfuromonadales bacterium]
MTETTINIDSLANGGNGVGRMDGKAVFVPFTAPGDRARITLVRQKKNYAEGELVDLVRPAVQRRPPACPVFGRCGGCQWQHLAYAEQMQWKAEIFAQTLQRQAGVDADLLRPPVSAPDEWHYRSRVQFKCRQTKDGFVIGFYRRRSHFVIDVEHCPIASAEINRVLSVLRRELPQLCDPDHIPQVDVSEGDGGAVRIVLRYRGREQGRMVEELASLSEKAGAAVFLQFGRHKGLRRVSGSRYLVVIPQRHPELKLRYAAGGFAQVNLDQNRKLVEAVTRAFSFKGDERVLDLFCGMGNFSLPLALHVREVVGVEESTESIRCGRKNARDNGIGNVVFHERPAKGALVDLGSKDPFDLVLLDPPREGAWDVVREIISVQPSHILYVSCDPSTLGRDLNLLLQNGYRLIQSTAFDLFPQTHHTESLSILQKTSD